MLGEQENMLNLFILLCTACRKGKLIKKKWGWVTLVSANLMQKIFVIPPDFRRKKLALKVADGKFLLLVILLYRQF